VGSCFRASIDGETQWESHLLASRQMTLTPNTPLPTVNKPWAASDQQSAQTSSLCSLLPSPVKLYLHIISRPYRTERKNVSMYTWYDNKSGLPVTTRLNAQMYMPAHHRFMEGFCRTCGSIMRRHMLFFKFSRYIAFFWVGGR